MDGQPWPVTKEWDQTLEYYNGQVFRWALGVHGELVEVRTDCALIAYRIGPSESLVLACAAGVVRWTALTTSPGLACI